MPKILIASETTYGTAPASGYRGIRANTDPAKTRRKTLQHVGIGPRGGAPELAGRRTINLGGEGTLEVPAFSNGLGILWRAAASTAANAVVPAGTLAYKQIFEFDSDGAPANRAITTEVYRDRTDGTEDAWTYSGGKPTEVAISQDTEGHLLLKFGIDYLSAERQDPTPDRSETWIDPDFIYSWQDALITLTPLAGGDAETECLKSFEATLPLNLDTDDWCIKKGTARHEPTRKGTPAPTGTLAWKYQHPRYYDAFVAGDAFSLTALWEGDTVIEGSTYPSLELAFGAIVFSGEDPQLELDGPTMQSMPFEVLRDGSDPALTVTVISDDTTY